jgi:CBS domain-containing protein/sporulation protein YlmC with PRC-barrel domain
MADQTLKMFVFLSDLLNRRVVTPYGQSLGKVHDFKIVLGELFPRVSAVCVKKLTERQIRILDWSEVETVNGNLLKTKGAQPALLPALEVREQEILLREEILDKQVVDTFGAKIERVNDIHLLMTDGELRVVHVDVGLRGILRRLGWSKLVDGATNWLFSYQIPERLISWKYIQPLAEDPVRKTLKLNVTQRNMGEINPSDLADILEELDHQKRRAVFGSLELETAAGALEEVVPQMQSRLLENLKREKVADIIEEMAPDEAVDLLSRLSEDKQVRILEEIAREKREVLEKLLMHPEGKAGSIMTTEFVTLQQKLTVAEALAKIRKDFSELEVIYYVYVVDDLNHLIGVLSLRELLLANPSARLEELMFRAVKKVKVSDSKKKVLNLFRKYDFVVVPVVDKDNVVKGTITLKDAIQAAIPAFKKKR